MSTIVQRELDLASEVPQTVKNRVKAGLEGREIDCSDIPELSDVASQPMIVRLSFEGDVARFLRDKAASRHISLAQAVSEIVKRDLL